MTHSLMLATWAVALLGAVIFVLVTLKKAFLDTSVQVAAHTNDSETTTVTINLPRTLSPEDREERIQEGYQILDNRKLHIHELMEEVRRKNAEEKSLKAVPKE